MEETPDMGYDMHIIEPDPAALAESERVTALLYGHGQPKGALIRRNQWPDAGRPQRVPGTDVTDLHRHYVPGTGDPGFWAVLDEIVALQAEHRPLEVQHYFRLNMSGMSWCRDAMERVEMIYEPREMPSWPDLDDSQLHVWWKNEDDWTDAYERPTNQCPESFRSYAEQRHRVLSYAEERPGINVHKLGSNDGWIVTAIECAGALHQWKTNAEDPAKAPLYDGKPMTWWPDWLEFLFHASTHGGFRVY